MNDENELQQNLDAILADLEPRDGRRCLTPCIPMLIVWLQQAGTIFIQSAASDVMCSMMQTALGALLEYVKQHDAELPATFLDWVTGVFLPAALCGSPAQAEAAKMLVAIMELVRQKK